MIFFGTQIGTVLSFSIGRYLLSRLVKERMNRFKYFRAFQFCLKKEGIKIFILLRMTSVIPYSFLNYGMGITDIKLAHFMIGHVGLLPKIILHVYTGTTISSIADALKEENETDFDRFNFVFSIVLNVIGICLLVCIVRKLRRVLEKQA